MDLAEVKATFMARTVARLAADIVKAKDAGYAQTIASTGKRHLRSALIGASFARLIPTLKDLAAAGGKSEDGLVSLSDVDGYDLSADFADGEGSPLYRVTLKNSTTTSGEPEIEVSLSKLPAKQGDYEETVAFGGMFWLDDPAKENTETIVFAHAHEASLLPDWFRFSQMAMASLPISREAEKLRVMEWLYKTDVIMSLIAADGGLAGRDCLEIIEAQEAAILRANLPWIAPLVVEAGTKLRDSGFVWGQNYLAYNDTDIRCCAAPVPGGIALFHENIDLIADHSQFVAVVEMNEDGKPKAFACHALNRYADSPAALIAALSGGDAPSPQFALDLVSGELVMHTPIDLTQISDYLHCALEGNFDAIGEWISGEREWRHARQNFEEFEPYTEDDEEELDEGIADEARSPAP